MTVSVPTSGRVVWWNATARDWVMMCPVPDQRRLPVQETWTAIVDARVHAWVVGPWPGEEAAYPLVVMLPGLGLPSYTRPTVHALARSGVTCAVLDLPGFGTRRRLGSSPDIVSVGRMAAAWVMAQAAGRPVVVVGHSTGAQSALGAALLVQQEREDVSLVLAGPTFRPEHRRLPRLLSATPSAYRDDRLGELVVVPDAARGHLGVLSVLRSGMRDAPEERLAGLRTPLTLTAGEHDAFAPLPWLATLAGAAVLSPKVRTVVAPGSHNNLYTHPLEVSRVITESLVA